MIHVAHAPGDLAARQAAWIAKMEPWRSLGYRAAGLARFLRGTATTVASPRRQKVDSLVLVARSGGSRDETKNAGRRRTAPAVNGVVTLRFGVLLGGFVSLLAVRPESAGGGVGRALMAAAEDKTRRRHRWLYVSADATNVAALTFYRKLGFARVGKLPDMIRTGHTEILLRKRVDGVPA